MNNRKLTVPFTAVCLLLLTGSLTGCFDEALGPPTYEGPSLLQFYDETRNPNKPQSANIPEGAGEISVNVQLIAETGTLSESHTYGVTKVDSLTDAGEGTYEIVTPAPTLEADSVFSKVIVNIPDSTLDAGTSEVLTLGLQPSKDGELQVAENYRFYEITIQGQ